jgi:L-sorbose 1-phosphate reductase
MDKLEQYRLAKSPLPPKNILWPLYDAGFDNLGEDGRPIEVPMPESGDNELLVRHDACGLCFSDIKVIKAGQSHPRIYRQMRSNPVVLGHEVSMTVMKVGRNLQGKYHVGDRFIIQADIFVDGIGYAYGYEIQGGLSTFNVIDQRILNGDDGNYLLPVQKETGYAESALTEPWACVIAAYQLSYRTKIKNQGIAWIIGCNENRQFTVSEGLDENSHPKKLLLTNLPDDFDSYVRKKALDLNITVIDVDDIDNPPENQVDDLVILGADPEIIERTSPKLADFGICAILANHPMSRKTSIDIGRIHYNRWVYVGSKETDIARAYNEVEVRSTLYPGGLSWFVGAGGPMGRMHVQRAIQIRENPATIVCTDVSDVRLGDLCTSYASEAQSKGIEFICLNPIKKDEYSGGLEKFKESGFHDIIVLAPIGAVITEAYEYLAPKGVLNVFAGLSRGAMIDLDLTDVYMKQKRVIGHSASTIDDLRLMLHQAETSILSPNRSVAAVGSLSAALVGLRSVADTTFPGKVVIFPQINEFPLTALPDLKNTLPTVYEKLKNGREWTVEAEAEFLRLLLP